MSDASHAPRTSARWLRFSRVLAFLPAMAAGLPYCGLDECPTDQRLPPGAEYASGAVIPPEIARQCEAPGPYGAACNTPVACVSNLHACVGQWRCVDRSSPGVIPGLVARDAAFVWVTTGGGPSGPLPPPELTA